MALLGADSRTAGKDIVHFDDSKEGQTNALVVKATEGNNELAAFGGSKLECEIEYRASLKKSKTENDLTSAMLRAIIYRSSIPALDRAAMATAAGLSDLVIMDESTNARENTNDLRKRSITLPVQAKLA